MLHASWEHREAHCATCRNRCLTGARPSVLDGTQLGASIAVIHVGVIARLASSIINHPVAAHGRGTDNARQQQEQHHECASPRHPRCPPRRLLTTNRPHHFAPGPCVSGNVGEGAAPSSVSVPPIPASSTTLLLGLTRMARGPCVELCGTRWPAAAERGGRTRAVCSMRAAHAACGRGRTAILRPRLASRAGVPRARVLSLPTARPGPALLTFRNLTRTEMEGGR